MKIAFFYEGPHEVHKTWADSINAIPLKNPFHSSLEQLRTEDYVEKQTIGLIRTVALKIFGYALLRLLMGFYHAIYLMRKTNAEIVLCEGGYEFVPSYFYKKFKGNKKLAIILADPFVKEFSAYNKFWKKIFTKMFEEFELIIAVSEYMAEFVPKEAKAKVVILNPFCDLKKYSSINADINSKNICFIGFINKFKGVDIAINVFEKVKENYKEAEFYIIGKGKIETMKKVDGVKALGRVESLEGYLKKCSIYLHLASFDPYPVSVLEAMSCGLIPIVSDDTGTKELVKKISRELIVKSEEEAIKKIKELFSNPKKMQELSLKCKEVVKTQSKEENVKKFQEIFYNTFER